MCNVKFNIVSRKIIAYGLNSWFDYCNEEWGRNRIWAFMTTILWIGKILNSAAMAIILQKKMSTINIYVSKEKKLSQFWQKCSKHLLNWVINKIYFLLLVSSQWRKAGSSDLDQLKKDFAPIWTIRGTHLKASACQFDHFC